MKAQETLTSEKYRHTDYSVNFSSKSRDQVQREVREEAHRLLDQAQDAISRLESLGPNYAVWQNAQASHKILKKANKDLRFVG